MALFCLEIESSQVQSGFSFLNYLVLFSLNKSIDVYEEKKSESINEQKIMTHNPTRNSSHGIAT